MGDFFHRDLKTLLAAAERVRTRLHETRSTYVVHAHSAMAAAVAAWAGARALVATCHGWNLERPAYFDMQDVLAYLSCDRITTPSRWWAAKLQSIGVRHPCVIRVGLDLGRHPHIERKREGRGFHIGTVCELTRRKGVDLLISALPQVWRFFPSVQLHVIGAGDEEDNLKRQAAAVEQDTKRVVFHGNQPEPYSLLADLDLFVLASRSDNQPLSIIEAMLAGLPVVAADVGGIPEVIENGCSGLLFKSESVDDLARALLSLLDEGYEALYRMGSVGERIARSRFSRIRTVLELERLYEQAAEGNTQTGENTS
jgi:glycosyltransferase involved in cell wall biosynthesis